MNKDAYGLQYGSKHGNVMDNPEKSGIRYKLTLANAIGNGTTLTAIIGGPKGTQGLIADGSIGSSVKSFSLQALPCGLRKEDR